MLNNKITSNYESISITSFKQENIKKQTKLF